MAGEHDDLLPMFVAEAKERLDRLATSAPAVDRDPQAAAAVRRELHTIKGAARMLGLAAIADLCHRAEEELQPPLTGAGRRLTEVVDALAALLDRVRPGHQSPPLDADAASVTPSIPAPIPREARHDVSDLDALADGATQLRILAVAIGQKVARLEEMSRAATRALLEPHPEHAISFLATSLRALAAQLDAGQRLLHRTAEEHLEALLELQLQPLRPFLQHLARHARELARSLGKEVEVSIVGEDTRLDRRIVRDLEEALLHLVRNAVDHGAEPAPQRRHQGKPPAATLRLAAEARGRRVRLTVGDDGVGIQAHKVLEAAVHAGLLTPARALTLDKDQALRLLFLPGLSTREHVTGVSGRGVGLDVVSAAVNRLGGEITLTSTPGQGTTFTIEVPVARRGEEVVVLRVGQVKLALPAGEIRGCRHLAPGQVLERDGRLFALIGEAPVPFVSLPRLLGLPAQEQQLLVQGSVAGEELAVAVDALEGEAEVLIRPLPQAAGLRHGLIEGLALLPSGEPVVVLSPLQLLHADLGRTTSLQPPAAPARALRVLLVEDSLVTREMERRLLEDAGFSVTTAGNADEALARLAEDHFDCLVTDVEMPGMDGFALTRQVRRMPALAQLPVVVVSTRDRSQDRLEGLQAGADAYLTKQGLDAAELVNVVRRLGGG